MFRQTQHIDTAFRYSRNFSMALVVFSLGVCGYGMYSKSRADQAGQQRIYILYGGKVLEAFAAERKDNIAVEARDHIGTFLHYFFSLDPDEKMITANVTRALYLADASAKKQYDNLKESGYYTNLVAGNISQRIEVDSIQLRLDSEPVYFRCFAREQLIRTTSILTRSLVSSGYLRSTERSDNNPHGFLIERWLIVENKDLKTEAR